MKKVLVIESDERLSATLMSLIGSSGIFSLINVEMQQPHDIQMRQAFKTERPDILVADREYFSRNSDVILQVINEFYYETELMINSEAYRADLLNTRMNTFTNDRDKLVVLNYQQMMHYIISEVIGAVSQWTKLMQSVAENLEIKPAEEASFNLTKTEKKILKLISNDLSYKMVAFELHLSIETVKTHVRNIYRKMSVNTCAGAVSKAMKFQLI